MSIKLCEIQIDNIPCATYEPVQKPLLPKYGKTK